MGLRLARLAPRLALGTIVGSAFLVGVACSPSPPPEVPAEQSRPILLERRVRGPGDSVTFRQRAPSTGKPRRS